MKLITCLLVLWLSACGGTVPIRRGDFTQSLAVVVDCSNAEIQMRYFQAQRDFSNRWQAPEDRAETRKINAGLADKIWQIRSECQ